MKRLLTFVFLGGISCSLLAEQAKTIKGVELQKEPIASSAKVTALPSGATVEVGEKKGFWVKVTASGQTGWLKLSDIELQVAKAKIDPMATGRTGSGNIVNTAGARGLSPDELKTAKPNTGAVDAAGKASSGVTDADVESFTKTGSIVPRSGIPKTALSKNVKSAVTTATVTNGKPVQATGKKNENW